MPFSSLNQVVWVRDKSHSYYQEWGKAIFVEEGRFSAGRGQQHAGVLVSYYVKGPSGMEVQRDEYGLATGICGWFPEWRFDEPPREEQLDRTYA